jgi:hypothetical protein
VGQAIGAAEGLAVHVKASLGLVGFGSGGPLLETGAFGAGGEAAYIRLGSGSKSEEQECGENDGKKTAHRDRARKGAGCLGGH